MARPTKLEEKRVKKLEDAFQLGCNITEACIYAGISKQTYYNWQGKNRELFDHFDVLRLSPTFKARRTVLNALEHDVKVAQWYLERKAKEEFGLHKTEDKEDPGITTVTVKYVDSKSSIEN